MPRGGGFGGRGGGGFGGRGGGGFGMRRMGSPLLYPMGGWGMGSPLSSTLMAGGLGYMMGSNSVQQAAQPPVYQQPYPYQEPPASPDANNGKLAQLQLLGKLHDTGVLNDDEFEREKQQILNS
jgi:hypothetical protein